MITVEQLMELDVLKHMKIIAGRDGVKNVVEKIVTLDYEFIRAGAEYNSAWENELVLTSFLYAKDDPKLILAAVKRLCREKSAGLMIRNVFHLDISDEVIRYANGAKFPIYITTDNMFYFEDVIFAFNELMERTELFRYEETKLREILYSDKDPEAVKKLALGINNYYRSSYYVYYIKPVNENGRMVLENRQVPEYKRELMIRGDSLIRFEDGMFYICTTKEGDPAPDFRESWAKDLDLNPEDFRVGVSDRQNFLRDFKTALLESLYSVFFADIYDRRLSVFSEIEVYQILFQEDAAGWYTKYLDRIMSPVTEYDYDNNSELWETLLRYEYYGGDLKKAAADMELHENSLRYRIGKIFELFGKDKKDKAFETELLIAAKIYRVKQYIKEENALFKK